MFFLIVSAVSLLSVLGVQALLTLHILTALMWPFTSPLAFTVTFFTMLIATFLTLAIVRSFRVATFLIRGSYLLLGLLSFMKKSPSGARYIQTSTPSIRFEIIARVRFESPAK